MKLYNHTLLSYLLYLLDMMYASMLVSYKLRVNVINIMMTVFSTLINQI